jgi:tRNA (guanine10-N2)-dimethyltransferase
MKYLFELSKEHKTFPISEIKSCLEAEKIDYEIIESNQDIIIIDTGSKDEKLRNISNRLSFTYFINKFLFSCQPSIDQINKQSSKSGLKYKGTVAIKYKNRSKNVDSQAIVKALAEIFIKNREVDLENPDIEIRVLITDARLYVGLKLAEINRTQFEERKVQNRPFFSPISLHPKIARAMVNLSSIKKDDILLDPFCGTGGILLEAGLIGVKVIGSDIENKMIDGCKKTLDFYNVKNYKLFHSDIGDIDKFIDKIDAIVTDLPYGKSTTTKGEEMEKLYQRAFRNMSKLLNKGSRAIIGLSNKDFISLGEKYFSLINVHKFRIHKSLNRYFVVYEK